MSSGRASRPRARPNSADPAGEFPLNALEYFFYLLFTTARRRELAIERAIAVVGVNLSHWRTLVIVRRLGVCSMSTLARQSTIDRTTLTRSVDQLVARGLVSRRTPDDDRRRVDLSLTDAGEEIYMRAVAIVLAHNRDAVADIDPEQLRETSRLLQRVLRRVVDDEHLAEELIGFGLPPEGPAAKRRR